MIPEVVGELITKAREAKKLTKKDLADKLCLGENHIRQLEEGGDSAFYSKLHKVQVAKKVAQILNINEYDLLGLELPEEPSEDVVNKAHSLEDKEITSKLEKIVTKDLDKKSNKTVYIFLILIVFGVVAFWLYNKLQPNVAQLYKDASVSMEKSASAPEASNATESVKEESKVEQTSQIAPDPCDLQVQDVKSFTAPKVSVQGNYVYLVSSAEQAICIIDGKGVKQKITLSVGEKRNIPGLAPFTLMSADFTKLQVYFQGWRAYPVSQTTNTLKLIEVPLVPAQGVESGALKEATGVNPSTSQNAK